MEKPQPIESPEPGRLQRIARALGGGTFHVIGSEDRSQSEHRMIVAMHERGGSAFNIARSAEMPFKQYQRPGTQSPNPEH